MDRRKEDFVSAQLSPRGFSRPYARRDLARGRILGRRKPGWTACFQTTLLVSFLLSVSCAAQARAQIETVSPALAAPATADPASANQAAVSSTFQTTGQPAVQSADEVLLGRVAEIEAELNRQMQEEQTLQRSQGVVSAATYAAGDATTTPASAAAAAAAVGGGVAAAAGADATTAVSPSISAPPPPELPLRLSPPLAFPQHAPPFPPPVPPPPSLPPAPLPPPHSSRGEDRREVEGWGSNAGMDEVLLGRVAAIEEQLRQQIAGYGEGENRRESGGESGRESGGENSGKRKGETEASPRADGAETTGQERKDSSPQPPSHPPPASPRPTEPLFTVTSLNRTIRRIDLNKTFLEHHHHFQKGEPKLECAGEPCPNLGSCGPAFPNLRACYWPNLVDAEYLFPDQPINCPKVMDISVEGGKEVSDSRCTHKGDNLRLDMFLPQYYELRNVFLDGDGQVFNKTMYFDRHSCADKGNFSFEPPRAKVRHYHQLVSLMYPLGIAFYHVLIELVPHLFILSPLLRDNPNIPIAIASHQVKTFNHLVVPFLGISASDLNLEVIPNRHADVNLIIQVDVLYQPVYQACGRSAPAMWGELRRRFLLPPTACLCSSRALSPATTTPMCRQPLLVQQPTPPVVTAI
ncbi:hypothetical protein CLOP_g21477 [Closterium sp. NIES-67]|nr:hypothetical protein CLOP_g21477 [Closterium sp. NIES-67]